MRRAAVSRAGSHPLFIACGFFLLGALLLHNLFHRTGNDLIYKMKESISESLESLPKCGQQPGTLAPAAQGERQQAVYIGNNVMMCFAKLHGRYMFIDSRDQGLMPHICGGHGWEPAITRAFQQVVKPGFVALDIGANVGWYTMLLSQTVRSSGKVVAVEAQPRTFALLDWTLEINGMKGLNVNVVNKAVSNKSNQTVYITDKPARPLNNRILERSQGGDVAISTVTIDDLVSQQGLDHVDFIKVDVEGAEDLAWAGLQKTIAKNPQVTIFMEVNTKRMEKMGKNARAFYSSIARLFPRMRYVRQDLNNPIRANDLLTVDSLMASNDGNDVFLVLSNS